MMILNICACIILRPKYSYPFFLFVNLFYGVLITCNNLFWQSYIFDIITIFGELLLDKVVLQPYIASAIAPVNVPRSRLFPCILMALCKALPKSNAL